MRDRPVAGTSLAKKHNIHMREGEPFPCRDSNPQSQHANGHRPTPQMVIYFTIKVTGWKVDILDGQVPREYPYSGRTAPLTSKRFNSYIYSTNIGTECFKHGIYSPFFPLQNAVCFILTYLVPVLLTFNIQSVLKLKKNPAPKG